MLHSWCKEINNNITMTMFFEASSKPLQFSAIITFEFHSSTTREVIKILSFLMCVHCHLHGPSHLARGRSST